MRLAISVTFFGCLLACGPATPPASTTPATTQSAADHDEDEEITSEDAEAQVSDHAEPDSAPAKPPPTPDYHARASRNATEVFRTMQADLRACYKKRLRTAPAASANLVFDVLIGGSGAPKTVDVTGGAQLGDAALGCMVDRVRSASFAPPHAGGTLRIKVPLTLRVEKRAPAAK
jgi:hypothetical protein